MFESEWAQAMQEKTSQVIDQLALEGYWFKLKEGLPSHQTALYIKEENKEVTVKRIIWEVDKDSRKYFGPGHAARLLISSFKPQLNILEKVLSFE